MSKNGGPQRPISGPLMFLPFVNDVLRIKFLNEMLSVDDQNYCGRWQVLVI